MTKWILTVKQWLQMLEDCDIGLEEIEIFYKGWRQLIPAHLMQDNKVQEVFKVATLLILERAV
jgi:hypothetical protein